MHQKHWRAACAGAAAGLANGLFGAGGGMILVPLLAGLCGLEDRRSFATALCIMTPLCLVSVAVYALHGNLAPGMSLPYLIGGFFGGLGGALLLRRMPVRLLHGVLGVFILWGGLRLWR